MKVTVFWDMTPSSFVGTNISEEWTASTFRETERYWCMTTRLHGNTSQLQPHHQKDFKSRIIQVNNLLSRTLWARYVLDLRIFRILER